MPSSRVPWSLDKADAGNVSPRCKARHSHPAGALSVFQFRVRVPLKESFRVSSSESGLDAGVCSFCDQGLRLMMRCGDCGELIGLCDECDAMWFVPDSATLPFFPSQPDIPCPFCGVGGGWEHWKRADWDDVRGTRWEAAVRQRGDRNDASTEPGVEGESDAAGL